jgi:hypothetical protein
MWLPIGAVMGGWLLVSGPAWATGAVAAEPDDARPVEVSEALPSDLPIEACYPATAASLRAHWAAFGAGATANRQGHAMRDAR